MVLGLGNDEMLLASDPAALVARTRQAVYLDDGETADTLAGVREARLHGLDAIGICNVVGSTIARECGQGVYIHAGPEVGVASTKAFTGQLVVLTLLAIHMGHMRGMPLVPIVAVIPLQLLAYHIAVMRGCDVDRPRNLAKSVTVE